MNRHFTRSLLAVAACMALLPAHAVRTTTEGGIEIDFNTTLSMGAQVRLGKPLRDTVGNDNGGNVPTGAVTGALMNGPGGEPAANPDFNFLNGDDGNLNYKRGDIVSAPLKGNHEFGLKTKDGWRALVRASWLKDFKTDDTRRTPLSEQAKDIAVTNWTWLDAWVSKDFKLGSQNATVRVGNQVLSWGEDIFVIGGINQINAFDLRKLRTPGAQVKEILRPAPMISLNTGVADGVSLEAYYQWKWNAFRFDPVGTFFSGADVVGAGQRPAYIPSSVLGEAAGTFGDRGSAIVDGVNVVPFERDKLPPKGKQFGVATRFKPKGSDTEFALYYQRYHDKLPFTTLFTDASYLAYNVAGIGYYNEYGQDKNLFGASFNTKVGPVAVGGEISYRPRDSVAIDGSVPFAGRYSIFDPANADANGRITVRGYTEEKKIQAHLTALYFTEVNSLDGRAGQGAGRRRGHLPGRGGDHPLPPAGPLDQALPDLPELRLAHQDQLGLRLRVRPELPARVGQRLEPHAGDRVHARRQRRVAQRAAVREGSQVAVHRLQLRQGLGLEAAGRLRRVLRRWLEQHHPRPRQLLGQPELQLLAGSPSCSSALLPRSSA